MNNKKEWTIIKLFNDLDGSFSVPGDGFGFRFGSRVPPSKDFLDTLLSAFVMENGDKGKDCAIKLNY